MATTETSESVDRNQVAWYVLLGMAGLVVAVVVAVYLSRPPQMGADEEVFKTVDALYTAVRMRDEKLLASCEQRLHGYRDTGKLPRSAASSLDGVISQARSGGWEPAARQLYTFMLAQRRDGAGQHPEKKERRASGRK